MNFSIQNVFKTIKSIPITLDKIKWRRKKFRVKKRCKQTLRLLPKYSDKNFRIGKFNIIK